MTLVASTIVRDEMARYLEPWVDHILGFCDELRVVDDGSEDGTFEYLRGREGVSVTRNDGAPFIEHESQARNALLAWTIDAHPTYVLSIDADEFVADPAKLLRVMDGKPPVVALTMTEVWKVETERIGIRVDGQWGDRECPVVWRAPAKIGGRARWMIPNRKLACGREPLEARRARPRGDGGRIFHFGWARESGRAARAERYFEHDGGRYHASKHLQSLLDPDEKVTLNWRPWPEALDAPTLWERTT